MPGPAREPAAGAPHSEERAPSSGNSLALLFSSSYSKHEQPTWPTGSGLIFSALDSELPGAVVQHNIASSVAHSLRLVFIDGKLARFPRLEADVHRDELLFLKALEDSITEYGCRVFLVKRGSEGSNVKLESVADEDVLAEEKCKLPSWAVAEAVFSGASREQTTQMLKRTRRTSPLGKERAAAGATTGCSRPLDWSVYNSWKTGPPKDDGGVDLARLFVRLVCSLVLGIEPPLRKYWLGSGPRVLSPSHPEDGVRCVVEVGCKEETCFILRSTVVYSSH